MIVPMPVTPVEMKPAEFGMVIASQDVKMDSGEIYVT